LSTKDIEPVWTHALASPLPPSSGCLLGPGCHFLRCAPHRPWRISMSMARRRESASITARRRSADARRLPTGRLLLNTSQRLEHEIQAGIDGPEHGKTGLEPSNPRIPGKRTSNMMFPYSTTTPNFVGRRATGALWVGSKMRASRSLPEMSGMTSHVS
jgi:hypothetical protein